MVKPRIIQGLCKLGIAIWLLGLLSTALPTRAQTANQYTNSNDSGAGEISGATPCSVFAAFQRDFIVTDNFVIADVNLGVLMSHNTRFEIALFLRSPAGNIVTMKVLTGGGANNLNILLDDQAATNISTHNTADTAAAGTTVPPYQGTFQPTNSLNAAYAGQNSAGTWTLFICDFLNNGVNGTFFQADLFLTPVPATISVLTVSSIVSDGVSIGNPKAIPGALVRYCIMIDNSGSSIAENISSSDTLPANLSFVPGSMRSGNTCTSASTFEDDDDTGADENDPVGASVTGSTINVESASLLPGNNIVLTFDATID